MRVWISLLSGALLAFVPALVQAQTQEPVPFSGVYTCVDAKGRKLTSDRPIAECVDREQNVLNPSGTVRSRVGPTLTARERADLEVKEKQEADAHALHVEETRREKALLVRYPSKAVHDKERSEALAQVAVVIVAANKRVEELQKDRGKLNLEMEFYKKDPSKAPPSLRRQVDDVVESMAVQKRFLGEQDNEIRRINARFDEELGRLKQLWTAQAASKASVTTGARKTP